MSSSVNLKQAHTFMIRQAELADLSFFLSSANQEGWNPGAEDALPFYAADPEGFFVGEIGGEKIGCISGVAYGNDFGFLGFYIVKPIYRHQGFGIQLWHTALNHLKNRSIGLDGVIAQQENYKKSGFKFYYRNIRFKGKGGGAPSASSLINLKKISLPVIKAYDLPIFGTARKGFLQKWINMSNAEGLAMMDRHELVGYGVIRACLTGYKIGPLFANNFDIALEIYRNLCARVSGLPVFLDVPEINADAVKLAKMHHMTPVFETARMYTAPPPPQQLEKVYGVTSFELG